MTTQRLYTSSMLKQFGYLATWLPGTQLSLGLVGVLQKKAFIPKSSIRTLGVKFKESKDSGAAQTLQFKSSKDIRMAVKAAGEVSVDFPSLPTAQAGVGVDFGRKTGVVFGASGVTITRIKDILALEAAIWDLWDRYLWDPSWVVVTELVKAEQTTVLVSEGGYAKVQLSADGGLQVASVDVADLTADLTVVASSGLHTQLIGENGLTPLFRAIRVKDGIFKTQVTGVRDPAPPVAPGTVARRGMGSPESGITELVTD